MKGLSLCLVLLVLFVCNLGSQTSSVTAIRCGRLFDGKTQALQEKALLLVQGDRIQALGQSLEIPPGAKVIDLGQSTVMPGLIDCHTHMFLHGIPYEEALLKKSLQYRAIWASVAARRTLLAGFTSIRDIETEGAE
ncbi:MAG TPA: amidohydrolase family protein, partial [Terriglobia bacterium]|nr:amidohydrolase family protein [Terriglobia bacterium]